MDRSRFLPLNENPDVRPEWQKICCDSIMTLINDTDKIACDKYYLHPRIDDFIHIFQQNQGSCYTFKRDGKCCLKDYLF